MKREKDETDGEAQTEAARKIDDARMTSGKRGEVRQLNRREFDLAGQEEERTPKRAMIWAKAPKTIGAS